MSELLFFVAGYSAGAITAALMVYQITTSAWRRDHEQAMEHLRRAYRNNR